MINFFAAVLKNKILLLCISAVLISLAAARYFYNPHDVPDIVHEEAVTASADGEEKQFIKWMNFNATEEAMQRALNYDINSQNEAVKLHWIELLAYLAAKNGGNFDSYRASDMDNLVSRLKEGTPMAELTRDMKYYNFYYEAYSAVLSGMAGNYEIETEQNGQKVMQRKYGLKAFSPVAAGYGYSHCDDFGNSRTYGFARRHLGNDLMGSVGTPVIAVESGVVEALGWNQYGGWRIGIRSADTQRYYYYAHLRKDNPYNKSLYIGKPVKAGDVIGYLGMSGYSSKENVNNINQPHLHFGLQIIFDESQKESVSEIWIDVYHIVNFLEKNRSAVAKDPETKDFRRVYDMRDPSLYE